MYYALQVLSKGSLGTSITGMVDLTIGIGRKVPPTYVPNGSTPAPAYLTSPDRPDELNQDHLTQTCWTNSTAALGTALDDCFGWKEM